MRFPGVLTRLSPSVEAPASDALPIFATNCIRRRSGKGISCMPRRPSRCRGLVGNGGVQMLRLVFLTFALILWGAGVSAQSTGVPEGIAAEDPVSDRAIQERVVDILASLEALADVRSEVDAGVVTLRGAVDSDDARSQAEDVVGRIEGVVAVQNRVDVRQDFSTQGQAVLERLSERVDEFVAVLPLFAVALAVFLLFLFLAGLFARHPVLIRRISPNPFLQQLLVQTVRVGIIVLGLVLALEILDATALIGAVLGAAGVTGIVLGFALKETIENYIAGLLLSLRQPFSPNDHVSVEGHEGRVIRLTSRATVLMSLDGNHVRIPNAQVFKSTLTNYTRSPERRFEFDVGVGVQTDLTEARSLAIETLSGMDAILPEP
ncbi:MAG: mechanosensitive ion channel, partial [Alphaproteobacteria bacterium]|nr:mechanosensitive ion channel [Alphaproteobacteria bacterium]